MSAGEIDLALALVRLRVAMRDADLRASEVEPLLGLERGAWQGFALGGAIVLSCDQERRARLAIELVRRLAVWLGDEGAVRDWLISPSRSIALHSPLEWMAGDSARLHAMVVCLRELAP